MRPMGYSVNRASRRRAVSTIKKNYVSEQSGARRHEVRNTLVGSGGTLLAGTYQYTTLCEFKRSFGGVTDGEPSPTASNNYQSVQVMNGSRISNYTAMLTCKNVSSSLPAILDVYIIALSFYDGLVWDQVISGSCPITYDNSTVSPADLRGEINWKTPTATLVTKNNYNSYKTVQHFMKYIGQIQLSATDGGKNQVTIPLPNLPRKCRRSNSGMFYGLILHNDSNINEGASLDVVSNVDIKFLETPSENRIPYVV